jgi:apolipoprotein D and lipocalin family protein
MSRWALALLLTAALPLPGALAAPEGAGARAAPQGAQRPVTPVAAVDLNRYLGGWYEIARIPNRFQRQCARHTVAVYGQRPDGRLSVLNQCIKANGNVDQAKGVARVVDASSRAKLQVSLVSVLGWRPFWGDYWIIGLDPAYRWAVVGNPSRQYGWILARTPTLDPATLETIFAIIERNGYRRTAFALDQLRAPQR